MIWDTPSLLYASARLIGYLGAFLLVGAAVTRWAVAPKVTSLSPEASIRTARLGGLLLAAALLARLYWQSRSLLEPEEALTLEFVQAVLGSTWGRGWLAQATAAIIGLVGWRALARQPASRPAAWVARLGVLAVVLTAPLTGHAVGLAEAPWYAPVLDLLHFGAGASWLGTLGILAGTAFREPTAARLAAVEQFSPLALGAGLTTMGAGLVLGWSYLGSISALWSTPYGRILLLKLGAVGLTAAIGAYNWRVTLPRLRQGLDQPLTGTARLELLSGLLILALTAALVASAAPAEGAE